jgi:hypothetical protein
VGVLVAHPMGVVAWIVAEGRRQRREVPQRVGVARAPGGDRIANERTFFAEVIEVNRVIFMVADPRAQLVM